MSSQQAIPHISTPNTETKQIAFLLPDMASLLLGFALNFAGSMFNPNLGHT